MEQGYRTVRGIGMGEYVEKKSRFIASVKAAACEQEALEFIQEIKSGNWNARHNCFAYEIVSGTVIRRYSDDGEPSGTAGIPILEVIKRQGIQNVVIVVTRYFGGILLGAAGLVRAYGKAATAGLENSEIVEKKLCIETAMITDYNIHGKLQNYLQQNQYPVKEIKYTQQVETVLYIKESDIDSFKNRITDLANGSVEINAGEKKYITFDENGKLLEL